MKETEKRFIDLSNGVAWAIIFSLVAIVMSICALAHKYPREYGEGKLGFDYLGIIVGILALLVTFLVAWQIAQTLISKEQLNNLNSRIQSETELAIHFNMYHIFLYQGQNAKLRSDNVSALDYFMRSLQSAQKCRLEYIKLDDVIQQIRAIINAENAIKPQIHPKDCRIYENIIKTCNHDDKNTLIACLNNCKSEDAQSQVANWTTLTNIETISTNGLLWN